jgi:hypothetical protein
MADLLKLTEQIWQTAEHFNAVDSTARLEDLAKTASEYFDDQVKDLPHLIKVSQRAFWHVTFLSGIQGYRSQVCTPRYCFDIDTQPATKLIKEMLGGFNVWADNCLLHSPTSVVFYMSPKLYISRHAYMADVFMWMDTISIKVNDASDLQGICDSRTSVTSVDGTKHVGNSQRVSVESEGSTPAAEIRMTSSAAGAVAQSVDGTGCTTSPA